MTPKNDPAKQVYKILAFQYKPLEARIKAAVLSKPGGAKEWAKYTRLPAAKKLAILDRCAASLKL